MSPPLRSKPHQTALKKALAEGKLQLIGTDHCGWNSTQKAMGRHDFRYRPASIGCQHEHTSDSTAQCAKPSHCCQCCCLSCNQPASLPRTWITCIHFLSQSADERVRSYCPCLRRVVKCPAAVICPSHVHACTGGQKCPPIAHVACTGPSQTAYMALRSGCTLPGKSWSMQG